MDPPRAAPPARPEHPRARPPSRPGQGAGGAGGGRTSPGPPRASRAAAWGDPAWQAAADALIRPAVRHLWAPGGQDALAWLYARGLADHTIRRFALGFVATNRWSDPLDALAGRRLWAPRGIVIPWAAPGAWYTDLEEPAGPRWCGLAVRRLMADVARPWPADGAGPKCSTAAQGSARGYGYPRPDLTPGVPVLIVEGEMDALLAFQEVGHMVNVVTTGGATIRPRPALVSALAGCPFWLMCDRHGRCWRRGRRRHLAAPRRR